MRQSLRVLAIVALMVLAAPIARAADAFEQNKRLGRGVNVLGYDPVWRDRSIARVQDKHFRLIREAGFNHVRINLHPFRDAGTSEDGTLPDEYLRTLDWAVDQALSNGLLVVLGFWSQVADRYKAKPDTVLFELLNEPNGKLTAEAWNEYLREALAVVRKTNPKRTVIAGPAFWNNISHLKELKLPENDQDLIVTVHYYPRQQHPRRGGRAILRNGAVRLLGRALRHGRAAAGPGDDPARRLRLRQRRIRWRRAHHPPAGTGRQAPSPQLRHVGCGQRPRRGAGRRHRRRHPRPFHAGV